MPQICDSMLAALWATMPALLTATITILAAWMLLVAHAGGVTRVAQLEHAMQKQAHVLSELQRLLRMDTPPPQVHRLAARVERLDMQLAELCTQVQADDQARELLNRLSGVVADLRAQLQVSIQTSSRVGQHTTDIEALRAQLRSCSSDHAELRRQAAVLNQIKSHVDLNSQHQIDMTRLASILDNLKAQLSMSNDSSVELMFTRTSLQEARALMAQALKSKPHHLESAAAGIDSLNCMHLASEQKYGCWMKPKAAQIRRRASVAFPSAESEAPQHSPELNADISLLQNTRSVSELGVSGAESLSRRNLASSPSGAMISPFASQLYQVPSDLQKQLETQDGPHTSGASRRQSIPQDKDSASGGSEAALDFALGGLPICRSLSPKMAGPKKRAPLQAPSPPRSHSPRSSHPCPRRLSDSRLSMTSPSAFSPDMMASLLAVQQPTGAKTNSHDQALAAKPPAKFLKAFGTAKGLIPRHSSK